MTVHRATGATPWEGLDSYIGPQVRRPATVLLRRQMRRGMEATSCMTNTEGEMSRSQSLKYNVATRSDTNRLTAAFIAALLGTFLVIGVGLANSETLHNAAHDTRHAFTFPCH